MCAHEKAIENEFSLTLGNFYVLCTCPYTRCNKLPFSVKHSKKIKAK